MFMFIACSSLLSTWSDKESYRVDSPTTSFPLNEEFIFEFSIYDKVGTPIFPTEVLVDAEMPAHGHGMGLLPTVVQTEEGYEAQGMLFGMEGDWKIWVFIAEENAVDQASFDVICCR